MIYVAPLIRAASKMKLETLASVVNKLIIKSLVRYFFFCPVVLNDSVEDQYIETNRWKQSNL